MRIAAFLAIRKLASSTDESIMDIVLKVRPACPLVAPSCHIPTLLEHLPDSRSLFQIHERTYSSLDQSHEKFGVGNLLRGPCGGVPTCVWIYTTAGDSFEE